MIDLLNLSGNRVEIPALYSLVVSAPTSLAQANAEAWQRSSFAFKCLVQAERLAKRPLQKRDLGLVADYVLLEFPALSEKTRSIIVSTFTSMVDVLNRGILHELFCTDTNITPAAIEDGYIVLIDLPATTHAQIGLYSQAICAIASSAISSGEISAKAPGQCFCLLMNFSTTSTHTTCCFRVRPARRGWRRRI